MFNLLIPFLPIAYYKKKKRKFMHHIYNFLYVVVGNKNFYNYFFDFNVWWRHLLLFRKIKMSITGSNFGWIWLLEVRWKKSKQQWKFDFRSELKYVMYIFNRHFKQWWIHRMAWVGGGGLAFSFPSIYQWHSSAPPGQIHNLKPTL